MTKEEFIDGCNALIAEKNKELEILRKKEKEIEALNRLITSIQELSDEDFKMLPLAHEPIEETESEYEKEGPNLTVNWDLLHIDMNHGEPYPEEEMVFLSDLGLVSKEKNDFVEQLHRYGYYSIEELMFNYEHHYQTDVINFEMIRDRIGTSYNISLTDWYNLYHTIKKVPDVEVINTDSFCIDFDKEILPRYFDMTIEEVNVRIMACGMNTRLKNQFYRNNLHTVADVLLVKNKKLFYKSMKNAFGKPAKEIFDKIIEEVNNGNI